VKQCRKAPSGPAINKLVNIFEIAESVIDNKGEYAKKNGEFCTLLMCSQQRS
jgi:hypothetical protein